MYEMKDEFKIGVEMIDEEHRKLFELTNDVYILLQDKFTVDKYDKIISILNNLKEYAIYHFDSEEKYMESINYKRMFTQKIEHAKFIDTVNKLDFNHIDKDQEKYLFTILDFLTEWLTEHILKSDKLIG